MPKTKNKYEGFSLIEILIVVALIIILATITIVAINPGKNFRDTRNAQRSADVSQILNAITQYTSEEGNTLPAGITACDANDWTVGTTIGTTNYNLTFLVTQDYIVAIPVDPSEGDDTDTGYVICLTPGGRVQISAPNAEGGKVISVKR